LIKELLGAVRGLQSFPDGWVNAISAHNGLKSIVTDVYLRKIAKHFGLTLDELLRQL
jgi:predicted Zn-dependent protease with MMP-like domain